MDIHTQILVMKIVACAGIAAALSAIGIMCYLLKTWEKNVAPKLKRRGG